MLMKQHLSSWISTMRKCNISSYRVINTVKLVKCRQFSTVTQHHLNVLNLLSTIHMAHFFNGIISPWYWYDSDIIMHPYSLYTFFIQTVCTVITEYLMLCMHAVWNQVQSFGVDCLFPKACNRESICFLGLTPSPTSYAFTNSICWCYFLFLMI